MGPKQGVESPDALEAARERHLDDRQVRLGEELLGQQQALGLRQLDRRDAKLLPDGAAELARAQPQVSRQLLQAAPIVQGARLDSRRGRAGRSAHRVDRCKAGSQLGPASQARPESPLLRQCRVAEEPAPAAGGRPRRADRPAIDPRGRDPDEEQAVEAGITRGQGSVTRLVVNSHDRILAARAKRISPFSDIEILFPNACEPRVWYFG